MYGWRIPVTVSLVVLCASMARAQQETPTSSPTGTSQSRSGQQPDQSDMNASTQAEEQNPQQSSPMPPLTGAITISPGSEGSSISYLLPSFQYTGFLDDNVTQTAGQSGLVGHSTYIGSLVLQRVKRRTQLNLSYAGGAFFYSKSYGTGHLGPTSSSGIFQELAVSQTVNFRRLRLVFSDQFTYLPESAYGFSGFAGLNSFGGGSGGAYLGSTASINPGLLPSGSILTGASGRISNALVGEARYSRSTRSTFTLSGNYGLLQFLDAGYTGINYFTLLAGYEYRLTTRDQISAEYIDTVYIYSGGGRELLTRALELSYARQLTTRLTAIVAVGPSVNTVASGTGQAVSRFLLTTNDRLQYRSKKVDLDARFLRYTNPGAGVLRGAESDLTSLTANRPLFGKFFGGVDLGHVLKQSLAQRSSSQQRTKFETWQAGVNLSHELSHRASVYAPYQFQHQISNRSMCFGDACGTIYTRHIIGVGVNWHGRPRRIH
jgi:hypothetical protein